MKIHYATSNSGKFCEIKTYLERYEPSINLQQFSHDAPEIQTLDQKAIAIDKARQAWEILKEPVLVDDAGIYMDQYSDFPGVMTKFVHIALGFEGILKLVEDDNSASRRLTMVFYDGQPQAFEGATKGTIVPPRDASYPETLPWNAIFQPDGSSKTEAEMYNTPEIEKYNYRMKAANKFLEWYRSKYAKN